MTEEEITRLVELIEEEGELADIRAMLPFPQEELDFLAETAILVDRCDVIQLLLDECSLDVNTKLDSGKSLLGLAARGKRDIVRLLLARGAALTGAPLVAAASSGDLEIVKMLVDAGADVNAGHKGFATPLGRARDAKVRDFLISKGAGGEVAKG